MSDYDTKDPPEPQKINIAGAGQICLQTDALAKTGSAVGLHIHVTGPEWIRAAGGVIDFQDVEKLTEMLKDWVAEHRSAALKEKRQRMHRLKKPARGSHRSRR